MIYMSGKIETIFFLEYESKEAMEAGLNVINSMKENNNDYLGMITDVYSSLYKNNTLAVRADQYLATIRGWQVLLENSKKNLGLKKVEYYSMREIVK